MTHRIRPVELRRALVCRRLQSVAMSLEVLAKLLSSRMPVIGMPPPHGGIQDLLIHMSTAAQEREVGGTLITCEHPRGLAATSG